MGGEIKSLDTIAPNAGVTQAGFTCNATASLVVLNPVTIGSSMWNRVGRKISLKSIRIRGQFLQTGHNDMQSGQYARLTLIYDKQPNGALPSISDVFQDQVNSASDSHATYPNSGVNLNNRDRFEVIADEQWYLSGGNQSTSTAGVMTATAKSMEINLFRKLKGRETHFKADSSPGVIGDLATGSLVLITQGDIASGDEPWQMNLACRLRYSDL